MAGCIWIARRGPWPFIDPELVDRLVVDHVHSSSTHFYAILCPAPPYGSYTVYSMGLVMAHIEGLGPIELSQVMMLLTLLQEDRWIPNLEYVDLWRGKALITVRGRTRMHEIRLIGKAVDMHDTTVAKGPQPTSLESIVDMVTSML